MTIDMCPPKRSENAGVSPAVVKFTGEREEAATALQEPGRKSG